MDNLTHSLVGLAASKAGLERLSPAATSMCIIAANAPDADIITLVAGRWTYLHHHRGITHSIVGTLALALLIPALFWLGDYLIARLRGRQPTVKFKGLLLASLIVSATHPLLDWTNNYGVRPLLPWSAEWYYGDLVFIIDPFLWLGLGGASFLLTAKNKWRLAGWAILGTVLTAAIVFAPSLRPGSMLPLAARVLWMTGMIAFVLAHRARLAERWGRSIAVAALALMVAYWGGLSIIHERAFRKAQGISAQLASVNGETAQRLAVMPTLANPARWQCVLETDKSNYRFDLSLGEEGAIGETVRYEKPKGLEAEAFAQAAQDYRAKVFLGFARFPVARVEGDCVSETLVQMADLRYTEPGSGRRGTFSLEVPVECAPLVGAREEK
jgi:Predicted membrane-bound metal-dependent hydrolases